MAHLLRMPGISADAEEVVFLEWCRDTGSSIKAGEPIATVETEKANVDIESDQDGVLWRTLVEPGESVEVGSPVAVLLGIDESVEDEATIFSSLGLADSTPTAPESAPRSPLTSVTDPSVDASRSSTVRIFASPLARKLARENDIPLEDLVGTGPRDRIVRADIERFIAHAPGETTPRHNNVSAARPSEFYDIPHSGMRRAIARRLSTSQQQVPHFYLETTCLVDELVKMRSRINEAHEPKLTINDFLLKATAKALVDVPEMNVMWMDDCVRVFNSADISVAIGSDTGLVTPVIRGAENLSLTHISTLVRDFTQRANDGRLKQHELEGGTFSISNLGMFGIEKFSAIVNPPQVAILAVGAVAQRPIATDTGLSVGHTLTVTLSADHRPVDGVVAARWLARFKALVENPALILV